ncbi:MAG: methyltransferase domain-containing protein [Myxococcaceae bacterium]|nr:methyltransferase domain-containing protein [Myxococcaceae bacterium]MCI0673931.1 methyltransferase domain-containing protein [Myxococcaceae bacterium]
MRALFDGVAGLYEALYPSLHLYASRVERFLEQVVRPGSRVLDVGCGGGQLTRGLPESAHVVGMDISEEMLAVARASRPSGEYLVQSYAEPIPSSLGRFDVVLAAGCLDYCDDLTRAIGHLGAAMNHGGRMLFSVLERSAELPGHEARTRTLQTTAPPVTLYFWSGRECEEALVSAGLEVVERTHAPAFEVQTETLLLHYGWWDVRRRR